MNISLCDFYQYLISTSLITMPINTELYPKRLKLYVIVNVDK